MVAHHSAAVVKLELAAQGEQILYLVSSSLDARFRGGQRQPEPFSYFLLGQSLQ